MSDKGTAFSFNLERDKQETTCEIRLIYTSGGLLRLKCMTHGYEGGRKGHLGFLRSGCLNAIDEFLSSLESKLHNAIGVTK